MNLIINFTEKRGEIRLELRKRGKLIDTLTFEFEANLDTVLIAAVDKILERNRIETLSLKMVKVMVSAKGGSASGGEKSSSAYKIAQTFIEAIKAKKQANIAGS